MDNRIQITYTFKNIQDATKDSIRAHMEKLLSNKLDRYITHVLGENGDAKLEIAILLTKNSRSMFDGSVSFTAPQQQYDYRYDAKDFVSLSDLLQHACDHYKEHLADVK